MRCNNCGKTIPDTSKNCPFCNGIVDPYAKAPTIEFGTVGATDYDEKHENSLTTVNKYLNDPKNKNYVKLGIVIIIVIILVFGILIASLFVGGSSKSNDKMFISVIDNTFDILDEIFNDSGHLGTYDLTFDVNGEEYAVDGEYACKLDDRYIYLKNNIKDPSLDDSEIIISNKSLEFELISNKSELYLISNQILSNTTLNLTIDDETGLLKSERYNVSSLLEGVKTSLKKAVSTLDIKSGSEAIDYRGNKRSLSKVYVELTNEEKIKFLEKLIEELKNDSNFINEYARITGLSKNQTTKTLDNYLNNYKYRLSGNSSNVTTLSIYYSGSKIYRIDVDMDEDEKYHVYLDIGDNKYYLYVFKDNKSIIESTFSYIERENESTIIKDMELTFDSDQVIINAYLELREAKSGRITKVVDFDNLKKISELNEEELNVLESNLGYYLGDNNILSILNIKKEEEVVETQEDEPTTNEETQEVIE